MDQNLTSLLINRRDHRLKKPPAYHLDLFYCGIFIYPVCGFLGLPFTHAATVRSMTHLISLTTRETVRIPSYSKILYTLYPRDGAHPSILKDTYTLHQRDGAHAAWFGPSWHEVVGAAHRLLDIKHQV